MGWGGVGWGGDINVLTTTSLIVCPDDYVLDTTLSTICSLEDATCYYTLTLRWGGWGGVGWGGDINVLTTTSLIVLLTTTSLILRCQHICSLEDATCYYVLVTTLEALSVSTELGEF